MSSFPIYRKLSNLKVFYKILSDLEFEEIQLVGSKTFKLKFVAKQYPEKLKIMDMINLQENYLESSENEWRKFDA